MISEQRRKSLAGALIVAIYLPTCSLPRGFRRDSRLATISAYYAPKLGSSIRILLPHLRALLKNNRFGHGNIPGYLPVLFQVKCRSSKLTEGWLNSRFFFASTAINYHGLDFAETSEYIPQSRQVPEFIIRVVESVRPSVQPSVKPRFSAIVSGDFCQNLSYPTTRFFKTWLPVPATLADAVQPLTGSKSNSKSNSKSSSKKACITPEGFASQQGERERERGRHLSIATSLER